MGTAGWKITCNDSEGLGRRRYKPSFAGQLSHVPERNGLPIGFSDLQPGG